MGIHSQVVYPLEACGLILEDWTFIPCNNLSPKPKGSFILDPLPLLQHEHDTIGIFHSHPDDNPLPSEDDIASTVFDCYKFIVGFAGKFYIYWYDKEKQLLKYEPFKEKHLTNGTS